MGGIMIIAVIPMCVMAFLFLESEYEIGHEN